MSSYWRVSLNSSFEWQWYLTADDYCNNQVNSQVYFGVRYGQKTGIKCIELIRYCLEDGYNQRLDWNLGIRGNPIVSYAAWEILEPFLGADLIEKIEVKIKGIEEQFLLLNLKLIECIDEKKSRITYLSEEELTEEKARVERNEKPYIERYSNVSLYEYCLLPERVTGHHLFWTKYCPRLIASNALKEAFEASGLDGPSFQLIDGIPLSNLKPMSWGKFFKMFLPRGHLE